MSTTRVPYYTELLFTGPSPATGFHFLHYTGLLNNDHTNTIQNSNLLQQINRVQGVSFSLSANRTEIKQIGRRALVSYPAVTEPTIRLDFEYLLNGLANDARIGLNVNHAQYHYPHTGGTAKYSNNFSVNLLSGLMSREFTQPTSDPFFPRSMRDNRNIFLVRCPETDQLIKHHKEIITEPDFTQRGADAEVTGYEVLAFGNCYLESYRTEGAVNSFPKSAVSWSCENVAFYISGSGCNIPAVNTQTRQPANNNKFNIPLSFNEGGPYILHPGDIILDISSSGNGMSGLGLNFHNVAILNYQIGMDFGREPLGSIGHKLPLDRQINFPVFVDLNFGIRVGDGTSGSFLDLLNIDSGYNVSIKLRNPLCGSPFPVTTGQPRQSGPAFSGDGHIAIAYDFRDAKFMGADYQTSISNNKSASVSFRTEINPDVVDKGFYISGLLNLEKLEDFLIDDDGFIVVDEDMGAVAAHLRPLY